VAHRLKCSRPQCGNESGSFSSRLSSQRSSSPWASRSLSNRLIVLHRRRAVSFRWRRFASPTRRSSPQRRRPSLPGPRFPRAQNSSSSARPCSDSLPRCAERINETSESASRPHPSRPWAGQRFSAFARPGSRCALRHGRICPSTPAPKLRPATPTPTSNPDLQPRPPTPTSNLQPPITVWTLDLRIMASCNWRRLGGVQ
jgi:hypothetical protein